MKPSRRFIRRSEVLAMTGLGATTIKEMEKRGDFPMHILLSPRCAVWELADVEAWMERRKSQPAPQPTARSIEERNAILRRAAARSAESRRLRKGRRQAQV